MYALHSMRLQAIRDAESEEEFNVIVNPETVAAATGTDEADDENQGELKAHRSQATYPEESHPFRDSQDYSCKMLSYSTQRAGEIPKRKDRSPMREPAPSAAEPMFGVSFPAVMSLSSSEQGKIEPQAIMKFLLGRCWRHHSRQTWRNC